MLDDIILDLFSPISLNVWINWSFNKTYSSNSINMYYQLRGLRFDPSSHKWSNSSKGLVQIDWGNLIGLHST